MSGSMRNFLTSCATIVIVIGIFLIVLVAIGTAVVIITHMTSGL